MAKIFTTTSMNRYGVAIANNREIEVPDADAVALVKNGLAEPRGWSLGEDDAVVVDGEPAKEPAKEASKKK